MSELSQTNRATTDEQERQVIERLYTLWIVRPELRLGQLLGNVFRDIYYYVEDNEMMQTLERFYVSGPTGENEGKQE